MAEPNRKESLEREALNLIQLGNLVQKERSEDRRAQVAQILTEPIPVEEKIRRIERIDQGKAEPLPAPRAAASARPGPAGGGAAPGGGAPRAPRPKPGLLSAAKRRAALATEAERGGFWSYLFAEGPRMRKEAGTNRFLKAGLLGPKLDAEAVRAFLERTRKSVVAPLVPPLETALREGWRFLRKADYNRLAALRRLLAKLDEAEARPTGAEGLERRLSAVAISYLPFRAELAEGVEILTHLESVLLKLSYPEKELEAARQAFRLLFLDGGPPPCLQDALLARSMSGSRRFLKARDLVRRDPEPLVSTMEFDCTELVQEWIDAQVQNLLERLAGLEEEGDETLRLRAFLRKDAAGNIEFAPLARLYESSKERPASWAKDEENLMRLVPGLLDRFLERVGPLVGPAPAPGPGPGPGRGKKASERPPARLADPALEYELERLVGLGTKLERAGAELPSLPRGRFMAIRAGAAQATSYEAQAVSLVAEAAEVFARLGRRLAELLRQRETIPASPPAPNPQAGAPGVPAGPRPTSAAQDSGMAAPRESSREGAPESGPSLEELSLRGSLAEATTAAYLAALRFQEPGLGAAIKNERKFEDQRRVILAELERLADEETFLAARDGRIPERPAEERPPAGGASQD